MHGMSSKKVNNQVVAISNGRVTGHCDTVGGWVVFIPKSEKLSHYVDVCGFGVGSGSG